jgi:hypothetical protein
MSEANGTGTVRTGSSSKTVSTDIGEMRIMRLGRGHQVISRADRSAGGASRCSLCTSLMFAVAAADNRPAISRDFD